MAGVKSILFVCTGNTCRSIMAEGILRERLHALGKDDISVQSAGVTAMDGLSPSDNTVIVMKEKGIDVSDYRTKGITEEMINKADLILTMEPSHTGGVKALVPDAEHKTYLLKEYGNFPESGFKNLSISDPIGKSIEEYRRVRDEIVSEIERVVSWL